LSPPFFGRPYRVLLAHSKVTVFKRSRKIFVTKVRSGASWAECMVLLNESAAIISALGDL